MDTITISKGEGYGGHPYHHGQVLRHRDGRILFVLSASQRYIREDGMSFGVGDESGYIYRAECRLATDEEAAPLIAEEEAYKAKKAAQKVLADATARIRTDGERPEKARPAGEVVADTFNIYGGGEQFVLDRDGQKIWYVRNNGADGDNWSINNIGTGGAGAIGWCVPWDNELEQAILSAEALLYPEQVDKRAQDKAEALKPAPAQEPQPEMPAWTQADVPCRIMRSQPTSRYGRSIFIHTGHAQGYIAKALEEYDRVELGRLLVHVFQHNEVPWQLWDDGKVTIGGRLNLPAKFDRSQLPSIYPEDISLLIGAGLFSRKVDQDYKVWLLSMHHVGGHYVLKDVLTYLGTDQDGRREFVAETKEVPVGGDPVTLTYHRRTNGTEATVLRYRVCFLDEHVESVYLVNCSWWYMAEDADAGEEYHLFTSREEAVAFARRYTER